MAMMMSHEKAPLTFGLVRVDDIDFNAKTLKLSSVFRKPESFTLSRDELIMDDTEKQILKKNIIDLNNSTFEGK